MNTIFIGIAGGTGSGKTTLTEHLVSRFGDDIAVVHHDNYYKRQDCSFEERCKQNYDHPDAFDTDLMIQDLKKLKAGQTIYCPVYDYALHNRTDQTVEIRPAKVIIVEGILIFQNKELRGLAGGGTGPAGGGAGDDGRPGREPARAGGLHRGGAGVPGVRQRRAHGDAPRPHRRGV